MNYNSIQIGGHITREIETRTTQGGTVVASFGIACNHKSKDRESVCFLDCTAFGRTAEVIGEHFAKGKPIFVYGRLDYQTWEDKQSGAKRSKHVLIVNGFEFVGGRDSGPESTGERRGGGRAQPQGDDNTDYGDIPF